MLQFKKKKNLISACIPFLKLTDSLDSLLLCIDYLPVHLPLAIDPCF